MIHGFWRLEPQEVRAAAIRSPRRNSGKAAGCVSDLSDRPIEAGAPPLLAGGISQKEPAICDGCQSREETPYNIGRFAEALCVAIHTRS